MLVSSYFFLFGRAISSEITQKTNDPETSVSFNVELKQLVTDLKAEAKKDLQNMQHVGSTTREDSERSRSKQKKKDSRTKERKSRRKGKRASSSKSKGSRSSSPARSEVRSRGRTREKSSEPNVAKDCCPMGSST